MPSNTLGFGVVEHRIHLCNKNTYFMQKKASLIYYHMKMEFRTGVGSFRAGAGSIRAGVGSFKAGAGSIRTGVGSIRAEGHSPSYFSLGKTL